MPTYPDWPDPNDPALPLLQTKCSLSSMPRDDDDKKSRRHRRRDPDRDSATSREKQHRSNTTKAAASSSSIRLGVSTRKSGSRERDRERDRDSPRAAIPEKTSERAGHTPRKVSVVVPEMDRRSNGEVRPQGSYPTFSKAHSREAVGSREDIGKVGEATEDVKEEMRRRNSSPAKPTSSARRGTPTPPLNAEDPEVRRSGSSRSMRDAANDVKATMDTGRRSTDSPRARDMKTAKSGTSLRKEARFSQSEISSMPGAFPEEESKSTPNSSYRRTASTTSGPSQPGSTLTENTTDSDATSIAPDRKASRRPQQTADASPPSVTDSQPRTPTQEYPPFPPHVRATPIIDVGAANTKPIPHSMATPLTAKQLPHQMPMPPPPPPPPPPMSGLKEAPRVDYLLKNGGLMVPVPKRLIQGAGPTPIQQYNVYQSPAIGQTAPLEEYSKVFSGIHRRLDDYLQVLNYNGSLAVATGYKSVARRLLDKLSQVFARDISSQRCDCVICKTTPQPQLSDEEDTGVSWGEILEYVAGRRELPQWPPFTIQPDDSGLGISAAAQVPMQKLDIDVPDEYRDHYIRQNQKTKRAVMGWLAQQPEVPSSPPEEADEDTLMFAMMTKLDQNQRNFFIALMHGQSFVSASRAPTPAERPTVSSDALRRAKKALQRLYRLDKLPRDCEAAMYLLNNPYLHGMLATLAEVNEAEWDILISGRFDGFLWSGAETQFPPSVSAFASPVASRGPSRGPTSTPFSRNATPFSGLSGIPSRNTTPFEMDGQQMPSMFPSRGPTPGPNGMGVAAPAPVQLDEDTEIAVAAELERNVLMDMERLEDAFEALHQKAESVRQMLRERSAGLSAQAQLRRGSGTGDYIGVRLDTPASGITDFEEEDDDGLGDTASLAPDDSASQISTNRRRRHRHERRTPGPETVPEGDESVFEEDRERIERMRRERNGRRSKY